VAKAVSNAGGVPQDAVKVGDIKISGRGLGTAWVRCPTAAANRWVAAKKLRIGWSTARVEAPKRRSLQCFRCMERGHTIAQCGDGPDRIKHCYQCGEPGHVAKSCKTPVRCAICASLGRAFDHHVGSKRCTPPKRKKGGAAKKQPMPLQNSPPGKSSKAGEKEAPQPQRLEKEEAERKDLKRATGTIAMETESEELGGQ